MKSARINFGIGAESEYVLEVDDTGAATRCFNPVTGQELGQGGGETATVTLVNNTGDLIDNWFWAIINEGFDAVIVSNFSDSGTYLCPINHEGQYVPYPFESFDNLTLTGNAETAVIDGLNCIIIKGDCSITIAAE